MTHKCPYNRYDRPPSVFITRASCFVFRDIAQFRFRGVVADIRNSIHAIRTRTKLLNSMHIVLVGMNGRSVVRPRSDFRIFGRDANERGATRTTKPSLSGIHRTTRNSRANIASVDATFVPRQCFSPKARNALSLFSLIVCFLNLSPLRLYRKRSIDDESDSRSYFREILYGLAMVREEEEAVKWLRSEDATIE